MSLTGTNGDAQIISVYGRDFIEGVNNLYRCKFTATHNFDNKSKAVTATTLAAASSPFELKCESCYVAREN
jgi:hypothetical protein